MWNYKIKVTKTAKTGDTKYKKTKSFTITKRSHKEKDYFYQFMRLTQEKLTDDGFARVECSEFENAKLPLGNGGTWCRDKSKLAKIFVVDRVKENGKIQSVELKGWNRDIPFSNRINKKFYKMYKKGPCVMTGFGGKSGSENMSIEIDHKDGRKKDSDYNDVQAQKPEWFQPLCKAANDFKREQCKKCKANGKRWSAKRLYKDFPFYKGDRTYRADIGCEGCYLYDPVAFRMAYKEYVIQEYIKKNKKNN